MPRPCCTSNTCPFFGQPVGLTACRCASDPITSLAEFRRDVAAAAEQGAEMSLTAGEVQMLAAEFESAEVRS